MSTPLMTQEVKDSLLEKAKMGCSLDGEPAKVIGRKNEFATVVQIDGPLAIEFSWPAVKRILNANGCFSS
jgi:hypothetical protein